MKTKTETLAAAMDVLAMEIQSGDGVANAAIAGAAQRLRELDKDAKRLDFCDTTIDLEPGHYVLRFPVTESCTIRQAIDDARTPNS